MAIKKTVKRDKIVRTIQVGDQWPSLDAQPVSSTDRRFHRIWLNQIEDTIIKGGATVFLVIAVVKLLTGELSQILHLL